MTFLEKIELIRRVDALIRRKGTGTAEELADRLGISTRCLFYLINMMKGMGGPIVYNQERRSYEYEYECKIILNYIDASKVIGGNNNNFTNIFDTAKILQWEDLQVERDILRTLGLRR
ncbi:MAG TPA: hypothetical protein PKD85_22100 [Saprospiraceae bacterium]|nr:hypothetical protein [Saprospiraceae bacterium]